MAEVFPVLNGLAVGVLLRFLRPGLRLPVGSALVVGLGALATVVSGEYLISWAFLLIDVPLVAVAAGVGFVAFGVGHAIVRRP